MLAWLWRKFPWRVPDGVRSAAKAADGGSQPRWTGWRALRRLQRALMLLTETPQYGKLLLEIQSSTISSHSCDFHPTQATGLRVDSALPPACFSAQCCDICSTPQCTPAHPMLSTCAGCTPARCSHTRWFTCSRGSHVKLVKGLELKPYE